MRSKTPERSTSLWVFAFAIILTCMPVFAGIEVRLEVEHPQVLAFEAVNAFVSIVNDSNGPLIIDSVNKYTNIEPAKISFLIENGRRDTLQARSTKPVIRAMVIMPDEKRDLMIDVTRWYDMARAGQYKITVRVDQGASTFLSNTLMIDVVPGIEIKKVTTPLASGRVREYSLRYWKRKDHSCLFLRVDEPDTSFNYGVFELGKLIRLADPTMTVDREGNVIITHQSAPDRFSRTLFRSYSEGVEFVDQRFQRRDGRPYPSFEDRQEASRQLLLDRMKQQHSEQGKKRR
jgi:hypothetical protein